MKKYRLSENVLERPIGEELILYDKSTSTFYSLNEIAAIIWVGVKSNRQLPDIAAMILDDYDVSLSEVQTDIQEFLEELKKCSLVLQDDA